ncbi:MAG: preprotein translocase subunit SecA, partial [Cyclobacteriaceae bacterium]
YKFEGFELFKRFIGRLNEETMSFLLKAEIPLQQADEVQEARAQKSTKDYKESKEESKSALAYASGGGNRPPVEKVAPIKSQKIASRNERVTVQYPDGSVKKDVKYKTVENDLKDNKCVLID